MCKYVNRPKKQDQNITRVCNAKKLIVVEGSDDSYFFEKVLKDLECCSEEYGIVIAGGVGNFSSIAEQISSVSQYKQGNIKTILFFRDADQNFKESELSLQRIIDKSFSVKPNHAELKQTEKGSYVGIFIISHNGAAGTLDSLCLETVKGVSDYNDAKDYITKAFSSQDNFFQKRLLQAFLARNSNPLCNGVGRAIKNGIFSTDHQQFNLLLDFLRKIKDNYD